MTVIKSACRPHYNCLLDTVIRKSDDWEWIEHSVGFCLITPVGCKIHMYTWGNITRHLSIIKSSLKKE